MPTEMTQIVWVCVIDCQHGAGKLCMRAKFGKLGGSVMGSFFSHEVLLGIIVIALWVAAAKWDEYRFRKDAVRRLQDAINIGAAREPYVDVNDLFTQIAQTTTLCAPAAALMQRDWVMSMVVFPDEQE